MSIMGPVGPGRRKIAQIRTTQSGTNLIEPPELTSGVCERLFLTCLEEFWVILGISDDFVGVDFGISVLGSP